MTGIALTSVNATSGTWFYTIDGGSNWTAVGAVSEASALLLAADADTRLYFQPNPDFNGTVTNAVSFLAWDQTSGTNGGIADVTTNGGSTAFSSSGPPANILVDGLGGVAGFGEHILAVEDEAQQVVDLTSIFGPEGIDFFGTHYTEITIDNNGIVYFGGGLSVAANRDDYAYYNSSSGPSVSPTSGPLASWQVGPISADLSAAIAVFWADVDTRAITAPSPGGNSTGSNRVYWDLDTTNGTLTVTWDDVGSFDRDTVPNAFQLQLIAGSNGDFDIVFRYETVTWEHQHRLRGLRSRPLERARVLAEQQSRRPAQALAHEPLGVEAGEAERPLGHAGAEQLHGVAEGPHPAEVLAPVIP